MTANEDRLIAWLDGQLGPDEAEAFAAKVAGDPALQALAERHRALSKRLRDGFSPLMDEPPPAWLSEAIATARTEAEVIPFTLRRSAPQPLARWLTGLAAAVALFVALGVGWSLRGVLPNAAVTVDAGGKLRARGELAHALDVQLASTAQTGPTRIGLTFRAHNGRICRSFEAKTMAGVACRDAAGWTLAEVSSDHSGQGQYRMAGETPSQTAAIETLLAQGPYDAAAEAHLAKAGWR